MMYKRGCIVCGWMTFRSPWPPTEPGGPPCPDCGHRIGAGPDNPASPEEIKQAQEALERFAREGFRTKEATMAMEKYAVVNTPKEKKAAADHAKANTPKKKEKETDDKEVKSPTGQGKEGG